MELTEILNELWPGQEVTVEELGGGITNRNFLLSVNGENVVLRLGGNDTHLLGIDRECEYRASVVAAEAGVGPEVIRFVEPQGWLVTRFLEGRPVSSEDLRRPDTLRAAARALKLHPRGARGSGPLRLVPRRRDVPRRPPTERGVAIPAAYETRALDRGRHRARPRRRSRSRPCHNDLLSANFIATADGAPHRGLGVRGHGRPVLRPRELRGQPGLRAGREERSSSRRPSARCAAPISTRSSS